MPVADWKAYRVQIVGGTIAAVLAAWVLGASGFLRVTFFPSEPPSSKPEQATATAVHLEIYSGVIRDDPDAPLIKSASHEREARDRLRKKNQVRPLPVEDTGLSIKDLPSGVFGSIQGDALVPSRYDTERRIDPGLFRVYPRVGPMDFEIHILPDAKIYIIGLVTAETIRELGRPINNLGRFTLFSAFGTKADQLVALPVSKLIGQQERRVTLGFSAPTWNIVTALDLRFKESSAK